MFGFEKFRDKEKSQSKTPRAAHPALYGVLKYSSQNIGDEIQSVAAMRFLPKIDYYCHRERLDQFHLPPDAPSDKVKLIMNAWWMWQPTHFPPSDAIDPLLISMYFWQDGRQKFTRPEVFDYLRKHGPVGCRDKDSMRFLLDHEVPAYFSGCLTMTLLGNPEYRKKKGGDYVLCVDLPAHLEAEVRRRTDRPVYNVSRMLSAAFTAVGRIQLAKIILALYQGAHCIVTSRLHVSLPSLAMGVPVLLLRLNDENRQGRFDGMEHFFHEVMEDDFVANKGIYDFDTPPKNPENHLEMREALVQKVSAFTGYDSKAPAIETDFEPLIELVKLLRSDLTDSREVLKRLLIFATKDELVEALYKKQIQYISKYDVPN